MKTGEGRIDLTGRVAIASVTKAAAVDSIVQRP